MAEASRNHHEVDAAIARVLAAEQQTQAAILAAREDATATLERARSAARAIASRAEARVARSRTATETLLAARAAEVDAAIAGASTRSPDELARLTRALDYLAREITGGNR